jgi:hypothetical protein
MKKQLFAILLLTLALVSCNNDNEKAMQEALNKAGIKITQQDSIIASQTYRCNYILTYTTDTTYYVLRNDSLLTKSTAPKNYGNSEFTKTFSGIIALQASHYKAQGYAFRLHYPSKSPVIKKEYKNFTVYQLDSTVLQIRKNIKQYKTTMTVPRYTGTDGWVFNENIKVTTEDEYVEVNVSITVEKNYENLYNAPKE